MGDAGQTDGWKNNVALAHPCHEGKSCNKFGLILPSGLGGDRRTDGRTDEGVHNIPITFFQKVVRIDMFVKHYDLLYACWYKNQLSVSVDRPLCDREIVRLIPKTL